jgi:hypothetical protein
MAIKHAAKVSVSILLIAVAGCCWTCKKSCFVSADHSSSYADLAFAFDKAAHEIHAAYNSCIPRDYDPARFLADLQTHGFSDSGIAALRSVGLEVWTETNCAGYVVVARSSYSQQVLLWDKSITRSRLDGPQRDGQPPPPPPAHVTVEACTCATHTGPN